MNIVTVYPIMRGAFKEELTYWSAHDFVPGTIIEVPLRGRTIAALVGSTTPASHAKANIRQASFMTRKIEKVSERMVVLPACIKACEKISAFYITPFGGTIKACVPDAVLSMAENIKDLKKTVPEDLTEKIQQSGNGKKTGTAADISAYQTDTADRIGTYKSIVREEFAKKKSVLLVAPTVVAAEEILESVSKGVEERVIILHGSLSKVKQLSSWKKVLDSESPTLIIATPHFASVPRHDIGTIIIERESSRGYMSVRAPYIDYRSFIEYYAKEMGARLILGDTFLRVETLHRREVGEVADFFPLSYRIEKTAELITVYTNAKNKEQNKDQNKEPGKEVGKEYNGGMKEEKDEKKKFKVFSEELHSMVEHAGKKMERMFIFTARRGLSPQTVCGDCGQTVECAVCKAPVVLHQSKNNPAMKNEAVEADEISKDRYFLCHHCGSKRSAMEGCVNCGSWKLVTLGIGIDTVSEDLKKDFPKRIVYKLDKDNVKTDKQARDVVSQFMKSKDGILLGTESALSFLPEISYSAIASLDSLFSIPDFRINERVCHIVLRILEKTTKYFLIQTRNSTNSILKHINSGMLSNFYRDEIHMREMVNYPPFSVHIKITVEDARAAAAEKMRQLQDMVQKWETLIFPAFVPTVKGKSVLHMLISVPPAEWPNNELRSTLASLPRDYTVKVNPESLL